MRFLRKLTILGLAAFGGFRIYELLRPQVDRLRAAAGPQFGDAVETVKSAATKVKDDVASAKTDIVDDVQMAVDPTMAAAREPQPADSAPSGVAFGID